MRTRFVGGLLTAVLLAGVIAGCSDDSEGADGTTTSTSATPVVDGDATSTTSAPSTTESDRPVLEDGKHFGYLISFEVDEGVATGEFDLAQLYTGDQAITEAAKDGHELDNTDYYIRNQNARLRSFELTPDAELLIIIQDNCCEPVPSTRADYAARTPPFIWPVYLTVEDGKVTKVEEEFFA